MSFTQAPQHATTHHRTSPVDDEGNMRCHVHGEIAKELTAKTEKNYGRIFYKCSIEDDGCSFFKWKDELPGTTTPAPAMKIPGAVDSPVQPQRVQTVPNDIDHTSSAKRPRSSTPPMTPTRAGPSIITPATGKGASAKCPSVLAAIQAGLDARNSAADIADWQSPSKRSRVESDAEVAPMSSQDAFWSSQDAPPVDKPAYRLASLPPEDMRGRPSSFGTTPVRMAGRTFPTPPKTEKGPRREAVVFRKEYAEPQTPTKAKGKGRAEAGALAPFGEEANAEEMLGDSSHAGLSTQGTAIVGSVFVDSVEAAAAVFADVPERMRRLEQRVANLTRGLHSRDKLIGQKDAELAKMRAQMVELENYNRLLREENSALQAKAK